MKIHKGDKVKILSGKDRGKTGEVTHVYGSAGSVLVAGANTVKKHLKASGSNKGGIQAIEKPLTAGKVALLCPKCQQPTRIGYKISSSTKVRICRKCQAEI